MSKDWLGNEVIADEQPQDLIWIWELEPAVDGEADSVWIRGYQDALEYMSYALEHCNEKYSQDEMKAGQVISCSMRLKQVSLMLYESLEEM